MRQGRWAVTLGVLLCAAVPLAAADERGSAWVGGGVFAPYDGDPGGSAIAGVEGRVGTHVSVGGEVESSTGTTTRRSRASLTSTRTR